MFKGIMIDDYRDQLFEQTIGKFHDHERSVEYRFSVENLTGKRINCFVELELRPPGLAADVEGQLSGRAVVGLGNDQYIDLTERGMNAGETVECVVFFDFSLTSGRPGSLGREKLPNVPMRQYVAELPYVADGWHIVIHSDFDVKADVVPLPDPAIFTGDN